MRTLWAGLLLLLAGCGALRGIEAPGGAAPPVEDARADSAEAARALAFYAKARQLPGPEIAREQESARRALARSRSDAARLRYAMLLTLPGAAAGDDARALELLEPVTRSADGGLRGLALLMTAFLQEQRRLEAGAQGLQQKLDALLSLERSMTGREGGAVPRKK
ncbi:MAG: hypothetical protein KF804_03550 [Burkholderiales bacterium]|jgi:hypothetical protein|nr:hypothetical protein [Burkholderiales bacterium]